MDKVEKSKIGIFKPQYCSAIFNRMIDIVHLYILCWIINTLSYYYNSIINLSIMAYWFMSNWARSNDMEYNKHDIYWNKFLWNIR
jgi:hypothetical protein